MAEKKRVVKPTGVQGFFQVQAKEGAISAGFNQIPFPQQKGEIELMAARGLIASMDRELAKRGEKFMLSSPHLNPERDFDIAVSTPTGNASLEMREIHPGGRYDETHNGYNDYDFAQFLVRAVHDKNNHYGTSRTELFLCLYSTDWKFSLSENVVMCIRYWLMRDKPRRFRAVFIYEPLDASEGVGHWIYPYRAELLENFDPEAVRDNRVYNLDPRKFTVNREW